MSDADEPVDAEKPAREVVRVAGADPEPAGDADGEGPPAGREGAIDPDDLDIRGRDGVDETDDGRYVISTAAGGDDPAGIGRTGGGVADGEDDATAAAEAASDDAANGGAGTGPEAADYGGSERATGAAGDANTGTAPDSGAGTAPDPLRAAAAELAELSAPHGVALAAAVDGGTDAVRVAGDGPAATLATALRWYASRVAPDAPPDETLAALLAASDLRLGLDRDPDG